MESSLEMKNLNESYINLVKNFFSENFSSYEIIKETCHGPFWHVSLLMDNNIKIFVEGDIGFSIVIELNNEKLDLWRYNKEVHSLGKTSEDNILGQLKILKDFLE